MAATQTFHQGTWHSGNYKVFGIDENASWLGMSAFDGARAFDGVHPDLDLHCQRSINSAKILLMNAGVTAQELQDICIDGIARFPEGSHLYIRITFWDQTPLRSIKEPSIVAEYSVALYEAPLIFGEFSANMSSFIRPTPKQAPTGAKASCLYPNSILAVSIAHIAGFDDCVMLDIDGMVAEFTMSNIFIVRGGEIYTPTPNGNFLNGLTRQRIIKLLRDDDYIVNEQDIYPSELDVADEIFQTGNMSIVKACSAYESRVLGVGPVTKRVWDLYMDFAHK